MIKKPRLIWIVVVILIVGLFSSGVYIYLKFRNIQSKLTTTSLQTDLAESADNSPHSNTNPKTDASKSLLTPKLAGKYNGQKASLINSSLVFPQSNLSIAKDFQFTLEASGLDLESTGLDLLKINGRYPVVNATLKGIISFKSAEQTYNYKTTNLAIDYLIDGKSISDSDRNKLLGVLNLLGVQIPEASTDKPIYINVTMSLIDKSLVLRSTKQTQLPISFQGQKE